MTVRILYYAKGGFCRPLIAFSSKIYTDTISVFPFICLRPLKKFDTFNIVHVDMLS